MAFGVYVHLPYCAKKCPYCDFNSYGVGNRFPEAEYTEAVLKEIGLYAESIEKLPLTSIFFGGGTPSLFSEVNIGKVIDKILRITSPLNSPEVTLEVNPETVDLGKLRRFREAGVNRISVGVQSFSERKLQTLGRTNTPDISRRVMEDIGRAGFDNFSLDLMFGVSFETLDEWKTDLENALLCDTTHISAYCLTVEENTEFGKLYSHGKLQLPDDETLIEMLILAADFLGRAGYSQYEISNFAKPGFKSRHNLLYWQSENYLGLGAGAHSHFSPYESSLWGARWANVKNPALYMKTVSEGKKPIAFTEILSRKEALQDKILMGLRLEEGVNVESLTGRFGVRLCLDKLNFLIDSGFIYLSDGLLRLNKRGIPVSNELIVKVVDSLAFV
ncbi:MAG TPA: radical SAM family heme chaperone HemW [Thermodesulfobacteriota bacterium]|nr:radical SAM family heme chaperone HemW [Thermodesulfobacteriota bacterium]